MLVGTALTTLTTSTTDYKLHRTTTTYNKLQWNPVNTVTNGPKEFGRNNEVTVLKRVSLQENVWSVLPGGQKSGRNNEVTRKAGFHCTSNYNKRAPLWIKLFFFFQLASAGLSMVYIIQTVAQTQLAVRKTSDVENFMTSVERVMAYTRIDPEPGYKVAKLPPEQWPNKGKITFRDVSLTYYPGGPQALKGINIDIEGGEKVGVAGRTGAGKSSFVAALLRMPDPAGDIIIDGVPVKAINLQGARRALSVLGQSPVLFSGSIRKNLDPMEQYEDADLWRVLEQVQLKDFVKSREGQLNYNFLEHGANISVGERQLICLARVLLQQNKIVVLDEPTAHVDPDTEQTIWNVVRENLQDLTVITIAHRLNTIKDSDKNIIFKNGMAYVA